MDRSKPRTAFLRSRTAHAFAFGYLAVLMMAGLYGCLLGPIKVASQ